MWRIIVGLFALGIAVFGGIGRVVEVEAAVSRCHVALNADVMGLKRPIDCRGQPSGPWVWPTPDDGAPEPHVDVDVNY